MIRIQFGDIKIGTRFVLNRFTKDITWCKLVPFCGKNNIDLNIVFEYEK